MTHHQRAFERVREILNPFPESPERQDALRLAADRLGLPHELQAGLAPAARTRTGSISAGISQISFGPKGALVRSSDGERWVIDLDAVWQPRSYLKRGLAMSSHSTTRMLSRTQKPNS